MTPPTEKPFEPTREACPIAASVAQRVTERAQVGLDKYGTNLTRSDLTHGQWLQHLQDELLDAANYVERLKAESAELSTLRSQLDAVKAEVVELAKDKARLDAFKASIADMKAPAEIKSFTKREYWKAGGRAVIEQFNKAFKS